MNEKHAPFICDFFKKAYIFSSLFCAVVISLIFVCFKNFNVNVVDKILANVNLSISIFSSLGLPIALSISYLFVLTVKGNFKVGYVFGVGFLLSAISCASFIFLSNEKFSIATIVFLAILVILSILLTVFAKVFSLKQKSIKTISQKRSFTFYFKSLLAKYPFYLILLGVWVIAGASFLLVNRPSSIGQILGNKILFVILLLPIVIWVINGASNKKINSLDACLFTFILALPIILIQVIFTNSVKISRIHSFILLFVLVAIVLCIYNLRYLCVKNTKALTNNNQRCYFTKLFSVYDLFAVLALSSLLVLCSFVIFPFKSVFNYFILNEQIIISLQLIPFTFINIVCFGIYIFGLFSSFLNCASTKICVGDFMLATCSITTILGLIAMIFAFNTISTIILCACLIACAIMIVARIRAVSCDCSTISSQSQSSRCDNKSDNKKEYAKQKPTI